MKHKAIKVRASQELEEAGHVAYVGRLFETKLPHKHIRTRLIELASLLNGPAVCVTSIFLRDDAAASPPELGQAVVCKCQTKYTGKETRTAVRDCFEWSTAPKGEKCTPKEMEDFMQKARKSGIIFRI